MDIVEGLRALVGAEGVVDAADVATRSAGAFRPDNLCAAALVRPIDTEGVSRVLRWCHEHGVGVVTQGGLSGLVHGADAAPDEIILSLERMRRIESIDTVQRTATVQAGVTLQALQEAVDAAQLAFPLDLGARGTATLGGNAATNAGGNRVIRYGMTRDMVLGLEVVLADGTVVSSMNHLIKNNTGYDLKQLFIGSEGTLGVITRLVLRLREKPESANVALIACDSFDRVATLLKLMDRGLGGTMSAFEAMWQPFYELVTSPPAKGRAPLPRRHPFYVLVEALGNDRALDRQRFVAVMESAWAAGLIADAAVAQSDADVQAFWSLRDDVAQVGRDGRPVGFDVSLPIDAMEAFVRTLQRDLPDAIGDDHRLFVFGHVGDSNLHVVVQVAPEAWPVARPKIEALVYGSLKGVAGSVSAEHGIGLEKKAWLPISRSPAELDLMRTIKKALDPKGILNAGKIVDVA